MEDLKVGSTFSYDMATWTVLTINQDSKGIHILAEANNGQGTRTFNFKA